MLLLLCLPSLAGAAELTLTGEERLIGGSLTEFAVDAEGSTSGWERALDNRLRAGGYGTIGELSWVVEFDLLSGRIAGDTWAVPGEEDERGRQGYRALTFQGFNARHASLTGIAGPGQWQAGFTTNQWGLGMVGNSGANEPLFGWSDFGDRVIRTRYTTRPAPDSDATITIAVDRVVADDIGRLLEGQAAWQGILAFLHTDETGERGFYTAFRHQTEDDRLTTAGVLDGYARQIVSLGDWQLRPAAEVAGIIGGTDLSTSYNQPERTALRSLGAAVRVEMAAPEDFMVFHARGGYASGDANPDDEVSHAFTFDRDFDVGMILFDEVMGGIEAASHALLTDPGNTGVPPSGVDGIVTEGSFRQAAYLQPAVQLQPLPWLDARGGAVFAWSMVPISAPFYSYRAGGVPYTHHNAAVSDDRYIGTEYNWSLALSLDEITDRALGTSLQAQGGHAMLGEDLAGDGPERIDLLTLTARVTW